MSNQTFLIVSFIGILIFAFIARCLYSYTDGKAKIEEENKLLQYNQWQKKHGAKVERAIIILAFIYGAFMVIQLLDLF